MRATGNEQGGKDRYYKGSKKRIKNMMLKMRYKNDRYKALCC